MGYERSTLKLRFVDEQYEGLEVRMRRLPLGDLLAVTGLADLGEQIAEQKEALDQLLTLVERSLLSWNLEEAGEPVPMVKGAPGSIADGTPSTGLYALDIDFILALVNAWTEAAASVAPPLPGSSDSGGLSPAPFELMEALSSSQEPLPAPG